MKVLDKKQASQLIKGASILTTGGGVPPVDQMKTLKELKSAQFRLVNLSELPKDGYLMMAVEIGPSEVPPLKKDKVISSMLDLLSKISGKKIVGLYPPEIGQESVVLEAAHYLNLPIADFDPVGTRAVPFVDVSIFNLKGIPYSFTPFIFCTDQGEILSVNGNIKLARAEDILREATGLSVSKLLFVLGGLIKVEDVLKNEIENQSYTLALELGKIKNISDLEQILQPRMTIKGVVEKSVPITQKGFSASKVTIMGEDKNKYLLTVLNEVIFLQDQKGAVLARVPERIMLVSPKTLGGLPSAELDKGAEVIIMVVPPDPNWKGKKADKLFGLERFKFLL